MKAEALLRRVVLPIEIALLAIFLGILTAFVPVAAPALLLHSVWVRRSRSSQPAPESGLRGLLYSYLDPFYLQWLPILILVNTAVRQPAFLVLLLSHLVLFPDVRESVAVMLSRRAVSK